MLGNSWGLTFMGRNRIVRSEFINHSQLLESNAQRFKRLRYDNARGM
jgi:hypothetical protein